MSNLFYTESGAPTTLSRGNTSTMRAEFLAIRQGFDKLPTPTQITAGTSNYAADTGTANAYVVTLSPIPSSYTAGMEVVFKALNANSGASTVNVNGLGVTPLVRPDGTAFVTNDIYAGQIIVARYDGTTNFQLTQNVLSSAIAALASANAASSSASAASSSASSASGSASTATTQAGIATTQAGIATTQAGNAANSATAAASSNTATAALLLSFRNVFLGAFTSDVNAAAFATANSITLTNGISYENTTTKKVRVYDGAAWNDQDADAQTQSTNAAASAAAASGSASTATTQAGIATTQAGIATTQAGNAATSATSAATQLASFLKRYQGAYAGDPTLRYDSTALQTGDLAYNTTLSAMRVYGGSSWSYVGVTFNPTFQQITGVLGTTTYTLSASVPSPYCLVIIAGGSFQAPGVDFTVSGTSLTFTTQPPVGTNSIAILNFGTAGVVNVPAAGSVVQASLDSNVQLLLGQEFSNRIINGDMRIDQRNAGASVTITSDQQYTLDRWCCPMTVGSKFSVQQNAGSVTPPVGFSNYLGVTSLSSYSVGSGDVFNIATYVEGFNFADLAWGTANAKPITLSFWAYSSLTGTFGGVLKCSGNNRSYPFTYSIPSANIWTQISLNINGDTSGTWIGATNGVGLRLLFGLGVGSTYSGSAGSWASVNYYSATGATSVVGTSGATFDITGVDLRKGTYTTAPAWDFRDYGRDRHTR